MGEVLWGAPRAVEISLGERACRVQVAAEDDHGHRLRVSFDGRERVVDVRRLVNGLLSLVEIGDRPRSHEIRVTTTDRPGELDVHVDGTVVRVDVDVHRSRRAGRAGGGRENDTGPQSVVAPMPGKVVRVLVTEGDAVVANQGVVVVEAMKMENELRAAKDGRVAVVKVEAGDSVESGRVMVVIE